MIEYKGFKIVFKPELNKHVIIDRDFNNRELPGGSIQACKVRISKIIATRSSFNV
jgi:hypothetical protein